MKISVNLLNKAVSMIHVHVQTVCTFCVVPIATLIHVYMYTMYIRVLKENDINKLNHSFII